MKIPKKIEKLIARRAKLAADLMCADDQLFNWLEAKDFIDKIEDYDILTGSEMYVNPYDSANRIRNVILEN